MAQIKTAGKGKAPKRKARDKKFQNQEGADRDGMYPIHLAIHNNDLGTLESLLNNGVNLNKYNKDRDTPILIAIKENKPQIITRLLEEGVNLDKVDAEQNRPLAIAISLGNQECIDLLTEYGNSQNKGNNGYEAIMPDSSLEFVNALIKLLGAQIKITTVSQEAEAFAQDILLLLKQHLNLEETQHRATTNLRADVQNKMSQFICDLKENEKITDKSLLNLARKISVSIQNCKATLPTKSAWTLNKIESLLEEKIVASNGELERSSPHIFITNNFENKQPYTFATADENWYFQNGYRDFNDFIRINGSGAGPAKFLKFSNVNKEKILRKTSSHDTETLELTTITPLRATTEEAFLLLMPEAIKRVKEEHKLLEQSLIAEERLDKLVTKAQKGRLSSVDESLKFDKILRPGKGKKMHLIHFHHTSKYEPFWNDLTKEAFLTGASIHLFNSSPKYAEKSDLVYSGIAIINKLLDEDVHPDKIILQSYGSGYLISKEVKNQFQQRGIDLTQINYQPSLLAPTFYPEFLCDHRNLHMYVPHGSYDKKIPAIGSRPHEFSKFAEHIVEKLQRSQHNEELPDLTSASSGDYSLSQLINLFITTSQHFLKKHFHHKNPQLPNERIESILGII